MAVDPADADRADNVDYRLPVVPERMVAIRVVGAVPPREVCILLARIHEAQWALVDPCYNDSVEDMTEEEFCPLVPGGSIPPDWRPTTSFVMPMSAVYLAEARARAQATLAIRGPGGDANVGNWRYSDPTHPQFGLEIDGMLLTAADRLTVRGSTGLLVEEEATADGEERVTSVERVRDNELTKWIESKRLGP